MEQHQVNQIAYPLTPQALVSLVSCLFGFRHSDDYASLPGPYSPVLGRVL
jgi:hypothetical protein